jgi:hypothetical protein
MFFKKSDFEIPVNFIQRMLGDDRAIKTQDAADIANKMLLSEAGVHKVYGRLDEKGNWLNHDWFNATHTAYIVNVQVNPSYKRKKAECIVQSVLIRADVRLHGQLLESAIDDIEKNYLE